MHEHQFTEVIGRCNVTQEAYLREEEVRGLICVKRRSVDVVVNHLFHERHIPGCDARTAPVVRGWQQCAAHAASGQIEDGGQRPHHVGTHPTA